MDSLADTHSSDVYRREVAVRETRDAERKLAQAARLERVSKATAISAGLLPMPSATPTETETLIEAKCLAAERDALEYLRLCMAGDKDCDVGTLAFALQGSRISPLEALLGKVASRSSGWSIISITHSKCIMAVTSFKCNMRSTVRVSLKEVR
jgi:hypothetical protein